MDVEFIVPHKRDLIRLIFFWTPFSMFLFQVFDEFFFFLWAWM